MDLLVLLAERGGDVVGHDEILARVWGKEFIADSALPGIVSELRSAFADDTQRPRIVETIPKRGYRLVAPVSAEDPAGGSRREPGRRRPGRTVLVTSGFVAGLAAVAAIWLGSRPKDGSRGPAPTPRVAVLPFEELGGAAEPTFTIGLVDELTARLAARGGLAVVSGETSPAASGDPAAAGRRLRADYVLTGVVRWESVAGKVARVRLTPQLIDVADATVVFSRTFDRSIDDVFTVQAEIADLVIRGVGATVAAARSDPAPTPEPEAYRLYLRARQHDRAFESPEEQFLAVSLLDRVTAIDPGFAGGWARLALVNARINHLGYDRSAARRELAATALRRAEALAPDDPDVLLAEVAFEYFVNEDYATSLTRLDRVENRLPQSAGNSELRGYLLRRLGRWDEALAALLEAQARAPANEWYACEVGITRMVLGDFAGAERDFDTAIALAPDRQTAYEWKAHNALLWKRSTAAARAELARMPQVERTSAALESWFVALCERDWNAAFAALRPLSTAGSAHRWYFTPRGLLDGQVHLLAGDRKAAREAFAEARAALERRLSENPEDARAHSALGLACAGLGLPAEAVRSGELAVRLCPVERDAVRGGFYLEGLARIQVLAGDLDGAAATLARLLSQPVYPQALPLLDLDPRWAPLRGHPRYRSLLAASLRPVRERTATIP